jgi:hypothetical protein
MEGNEDQLMAGTSKKILIFDLKCPAACKIGKLSSDNTKANNSDKLEQKTRMTKEVNWLIVPVSRLLPDPST